MPRATHTLLPRNKFAKRHYEAIALALQEARRSVNGSNDPITVVIEELADVFARDNGMFSSVNGSSAPASLVRMCGRGLMEGHAND